MKARREKERTVLERDLMDLLADSKRTEQRVADALITVLRRADHHTLAAIGVIVAFVAAAARRPR